MEAASHCVARRYSSGHRMLTDGGAARVKRWHPPPVAGRGSTSMCTLQLCLLPAPSHRDTIMPRELRDRVSHTSLVDQALCADSPCPFFFG
jgi:hypothetical protein